MGFAKKHSLTEQKKGWTKKEVQKIDGILRINEPLIELVLFHVGIDTMLRVSDLLALKVGDLLTKSGSVKEEYLIKQKKTGERVAVILHPPTREAIEKYLIEQKLQRTDYLFPSPKVPKHHLSSWWVRQMVKKWADLIGLPIEQYSSHSLRRTGAIYLYYASGKDLEVVRQALGHTSIEATKHYLGIESLHVKEVLKKNPMWKVSITDKYKVFSLCNETYVWLTGFAKKSAKLTKL